MKLFLLSCQTIEPYADRILPLLPAQRQLAYARSHSDLTLGAGLLLSSLLHVHTNEDLVFGPHGKPHLNGGTPEFSLSHSGNHVLLGVSDSPIGVDMELRTRPVTPAVQARICMPHEMGLDPLLVFTRKECAMKLTGLGFSLPLQEIDISSDYVWKNRTYRFFTVEHEGYVISVLSSEDGLAGIQTLTPEELL